LGFAAFGEFPLVSGEIEREVFGVAIDRRQATHALRI
jgi:hypothetical protein